MSNASEQSPGGFGDRTTPSRRVIDWILAVLLIFLGLGITGIGGLLVSITDREWFEELVAEGTIESDIITEAELVDAMVAFSWWGGMGIVLAGVVMVLGGIAFGVARRRIDRMDEGAETPTFVANALIGAAITVLVSFIPLSGLLGGGVAGYLETADSWNGALVGATAALVLAVPVAVAAVVLSIGLIIEDLVILALGLLLGLMFTVAFSMGISAIGGAIGSYLHKRG